MHWCITDQELPTEAKQVDHQLHDKTGNRGGEASTSTADQSPLGPIGNEHTAKWKIYTTMARKLAEQVRGIALALPLHCYKSVIELWKLDALLFNIAHQACLHICSARLVLGAWLGCLSACKIVVRLYNCSSYMLSCVVGLMQIVCKLPHATVSSMISFVSQMAYFLSLFSKNQPQGVR